MALTRTIPPPRRQHRGQRPGQPRHAAGAGQRAQAGAHLRRHHAVGRQAVLQELAGARLVHLLAVDRKLRGSLPGEQNYFAPNGGNAYDTPDLYINQNGPLPNDRPHSATSTATTRHAARQGAHHLRAVVHGALGHAAQLHSAIVPAAARSSCCCRAGRAAARRPITQLDGKIAYRRRWAQDEARGVHRPLQPLQPAGGDPHRRQLHVRAAPPIVNGTPQDLKYAKNANGAPITKNPNYGQPLRIRTVQRPPGPAPDVLVGTNEASRSRPAAPGRASA